MEEYPIVEPNLQIENIFADVEMLPVESCNKFDRLMELPYNIKHYIIAMVDKKSLLQVSLVCWELNQIVCPLIKKNFSLTIDLNSQDYEYGNNNKAIADTLATILSNSTNGARKYSKITLRNIGGLLRTEFRALILFALSTFGEPVKELSIEDSGISYSDGIELLACFKNVKRLMLKRVDVYSSSAAINPDYILPELKELHIICSAPRILNWFLHCNSLLTFEFEQDLLRYIGFQFEYDMQEFENFLIAQSSLKHLILSFLLELDMFKEDRSDEIKFQLESLVLLETYFMNSTNSLSFFETQKNLKYLEIWIEESDHHLTRGYREILKQVYSQPTLVKVTTNGAIEDTSYFCPNASVKFLEFSEPASTDKILAMMKLFPNIRNICINSSLLRLETFKSENLRLIQSREALLTFSYQPAAIDIDGKLFEIMVKCFLLRNNKIQSLTLGHRSWIANGLGLSLKFCLDLFRILPDLKHLELYNPLQIKNLVMFLLCSRNSFESITLVTNEDGKAAVKRMQRKDCLNIIVA